MKYLYVLGAGTMVVIAMVGTKDMAVSFLAGIFMLLAGITQMVCNIYEKMDEK